MGHLSTDTAGLKSPYEEGVTDEMEDVYQELLQQASTCISGLPAIVRKRKPSKTRAYLVMRTDHAKLDEVVEQTQSLSIGEIQQLLEAGVRCEAIMADHVRMTVVEKPVKKPDLHARFPIHAFSIGCRQLQAKLLNVLGEHFEAAREKGKMASQQSRRGN